VLAKRTKDSDIIAAANDLLDRAGVRAEQPAEASTNDGTVLGEEFVQIHRRRVLQANGGTTTEDTPDAAT
jgi:hypothetical protein